MTTKLSVGLCKKQSLPNFGSIGANCGLEIEIDPVAVQDATQFREQVEQAYATVRHAVETELAREVGLAEQRGDSPSPDVSTSHPQNCENPRPATKNQIRAIHAIARKAGSDLVSHLSAFGVRSVDQLSLRDASKVIDNLKTLIPESDSRKSA